MAAGRTEDVLIIGAGPSGLAVAIASAAQGMRVRVVDVAQPPVEKACGEGLLPDAVASLVRMGVRLRGGHPIAGIRFLEGCRVANARFTGEPGRGLRRTTLHSAMLERAGALGIEVEWGTTIRGLDACSASFLVGADGGQSRVRWWGGLDRSDNVSVTSRRVGLRQHFAVRPWSACVEVHWADAGQAYVTPVGEGEVGVAFVSRQRFLSVAEALLRFPTLRERLGSAAPTSKPRGAATVTRRLRRVTAGRRVALVGDASGSVDAVTGEGLNLCFHQAEALARAMATGRLDAYEAAHRAIMRVPRLMSSMLLTLDRRPRLRAAAFAGLELCPALFDGLLRIHAGVGPRSISSWAPPAISTTDG